MNPTDVDNLVDAYKEGDIKAFEKLYEMYAASMLGVIYNVLGNKEMAEDTLQEVFIKVWKNSSSFDSSKGRFFTWILNISRNAAIDKTRSREFKKQSHDVNLDPFTDNLPINENIENRTVVVQLKQFISTLDKKCRQILEYVYFKDYTQQETSEALKLPLGTVKTRVRSCMNRLRKFLTLSE